jgi:hypothetical protein
MTGEARVIVSDMKRTISGTYCHGPRTEIFTCMAMNLSADLMADSMEYLWGCEPSDHGPVQCDSSHLGSKISNCMVSHPRRQWLEYWLLWEPQILLFAVLIPISYSLTKKKKHFLEAQCAFFAQDVIVFLVNITIHSSWDFNMEYCSN